MPKIFWKPDGNKTAADDYSRGFLYVLTNPASPDGNMGNGWKHYDAADDRL